MSVIDLQGTNWVYYSKIKRFSGVIALKIGCVVLAAGNARRFGSNKLKAQVDGESLIRRALEAVPSGLVTVVVSQYPDILALAGEYGFAAVANDRPDLGLSRSVRLGLERLSDCDGVLFLVSDSFRSRSMPL